MCLLRMTLRTLKSSVEKDRMRTFITFCSVCLACFIQASEADSLRFANPFEHPITFSGNFGELRANHFHGGLDFKTQGVEGKPVRALADGYVSRIRVTHGSGYVLHVTYNNGYETINRHLSAFAGPIAWRVKNLQYERESWEVDINPLPGEYPVKRGQLIAYSGNTGYSFGPHLHLDVIEQVTGDYVDPLPFFASQVKDHTAPRATGFMLFPQAGKGMVNGKTDPQKFAIGASQHITAWGEIGAAIRAYDYMDGVHNKYGVHTVVLRVDGQEVFRSEVSRFAYEENRYINSWTYDGYMKSFIAPNNSLRMLHATGGNRGLVTIDEERPYRFEYTLSDALGNTSRVGFTVQGCRMEIPAREEKNLFRWEAENVLHMHGLFMMIPYGSLYEDAPYDFEVLGDSSDISFTYSFGKRPIPLHESGSVFIKLRHLPVKDYSKYYVACVSPQGKKRSIGRAMVADSLVMAYTYELGTFTACVDTVPPMLTAVRPSTWGKTGRIVIKAVDRETGVTSYRGTIDGKYALFGKSNSIKNDLVCVLDPQRVRQGIDHELMMTVTDACGNVTTRSWRFHW